METAIVLFTRDLRLHDNPALHLACDRARQVVPLFVVDPAIGGPPNRIAFLAQSLADLRDNMRQLGGELVIRTGDPAAEVVKLAAEVNAEAVYLADDVSHYASRRRQRLERDCAKRRLDLNVTAGLTVVPPADLKPASGGHYRVFTPYWRAWRAARWRPHYPVPRAITTPHVKHPGQLPTAGPGVSPGLAPGGETAGRQRFTGWRRGQLAGYDEHHDDLAGDQTSRLSAYLRFGCVSPLEVAIGARDFGGRPGGEEFSWPGEISFTRSPRRSRTWPGRTTGPARPGTPMPMRWRPGAPGRPGYRSWTPECASWPPRGSCTTGPG